MYIDSQNMTTISIADAYFASLYWSASTISLIGSVNLKLAPTCTREYIYAFIVQIISLLLFIYNISTITSITALSSAEVQKQDIVLDNYLELFDVLRLDSRLKFTVNCVETYSRSFNI
jgi:hypothetical protein